MRVFIVSKWILPFGYGLCLYKWVFVRKDSLHLDVLIAHEYYHTVQWQQLGFFKFIYEYTKELIKNGYQLNRFEIEARQYASTHWANFVQYKEN